MSSSEPPDVREPNQTEERIEADRERAGEAGDGLAQAVDRHRGELGMPPEPADGEDVELG